MAFADVIKGGVWPFTDREVKREREREKALKRPNICADVIGRYII